jgi:hypothetical protein
MKSVHVSPTLFWYKFSLCNPDWPETHSPPFSTSLLLGLQVCTTMPNQGDLLAQSYFDWPVTKSGMGFSTCGIWQCSESFEFWLCGLGMLSLYMCSQGCWQLLHPCGGNTVWQCDTTQFLTTLCALTAYLKSVPWNSAVPETRMSFPMDSVKQLPEYHVV